MFEVRFEGYKYNTGSGDNGEYECEEEFENFNESIEFIRYLINLMEKHKNKLDYSEKDFDFFEKHDINFITKIVGLFEVETLEREIHIRSFL